MSTAEAWIEESLMRLEQLEGNRQTHEDSMETSTDEAERTHHEMAIAELTDEIGALYEVLEHAATDDEAAETIVDGPAASMTFPANDPVNLRETTEIGPENPFALPPSVTNYNAPPIEPEPMPDFGPIDSGNDFEVIKSVNPIKIAVPAALAVVGLLAGYLMLGGGAETEAPQTAAAPTEARVIPASEIPDDTQGPIGAKGADVDRNQGTKIIKSRRSHSAPAARPKRRTQTPKQTGRTIHIEKSDDPLAGIN